MSSVNAFTPDVGAQIRKAREEAGLTQVQLAEQLDQAERTVQAWERNERTPRMPALVALAAHLGQPVAFFYGDANLPEPDREAA